ncbi:MAG: hypothetical protein BAJALOKI2v1_300038 [Promethearchaeota archaeon]|nr:MAG: hypothetical protein BAJALOKI2v1_300038 [Candidatus Lokiarchaeota archaeon]
MTNLEKNVGKIDRIIRSVIGIILLAIAIFMLVNNPNQFLIPTILIIFGIISLGTAATGMCWLYKPFNINTRK